MINLTSIFLIKSNHQPKRWSYSTLSQEKDRKIKVEKIKFENIKLLNQKKSRNFLKVFLIQIYMKWPHFLCHFDYILAITNFF